MKRALGTIGLIVSSLCLAAALGEGLVRGAMDVPVTPQMFVSDEVTDFRLKPNVRERLVWPGNVKFSWTTNSRGYRTTREFTVPKPAATKRVLLLGDSFTFGQGVDDSQTFAAEAQRRLEVACPATRVEIINAGVPGFGTSQELARLESEGLALEPDVVVLGFYGNDPDDNLRRGVYLLAGDTLVRRPAKARPQLYRVKEVVDKVPGYAWLAAHSHLFNLLRRAYVSAAANNAASASDRAVGSAQAPGPREGIRSDDEYAWRLMRALLSRMRESVRRADSHLMVLLIPDTADIRGLSDAVVTRPSGVTAVARMRTLCGDLGLECLDLVQWLRSSGRALGASSIYIPGEFHFTAGANAWAGEFLANHVRPAVGCA